MTSEKQPYNITVTTVYDKISRDYSNLDDVWDVIDSIKMGHNALLPVADSPIIFVSTKDIQSIAITGISAAELIKYREDKYQALAREKSAAYQAQCEQGYSGAGLVGGLNSTRIGII